MPTKITYKSNPIATIRGQQTATIKCSGKKMTDDLVIETNEVATIDISDTTAIASDVLQGKEFYTAEEVKVEGTIPTIEATNREITTLSGVHYEQGYYNNAWDVAISQTEQAKIIPQNIKSGVDILGVTGILEEGGGSDITLNGVIEQYKVEAGETVNAGDFIEFVTKYASGTIVQNGYLNAVGLSESKILICYYSGGNKFQVVKIEGNNLFVGEVFNFAGGVYYSIDKLSDTNVIFTYISSQNLYGALLTINDTSISSSEAVLIQSGLTMTSGYYKCKVIALTTNKAIVVYCGANNYFSARILTISDSIIVGGLYPVGNLAIGKKVYFIEGVKLNDDKIVVIATACRNDISSASFNNYIAVVNVNGVTISSGEWNVIRTSPADIAITALTETEVLVAFAYNSSSSASYYYVHAYKIDGESFTLESSSTATVSGNTSTGQKGHIEIMRLSPTKAIMAVYKYLSASPSYYYYFYPITYSESAITFGTSIRVGAISTYNDINNTPLYSPLKLIALSDKSCFVYYDGNYKSYTLEDDTLIENTVNSFSVKTATSNLYIGGLAKTSGVGGETIDVYRVPKVVFVALNLTNVTSTQYSTSMSQLETQTITITANEGYLLPETIVVSGADYTWNSSNGVLVISNPTSNVNISITGQQITLSAPTITIIENTLTITDTSGLATSYDILVDGAVQTTISLTTFDMTILGLSGGTYSITVVAKADGYGDSVESNAISYVVEEASGFTVEISSGVQGYMRCYDGQNQDAPELGYAEPYGTKTFTVTSGYLFGVGNDQEISAPSVTGGVTLIESNVGGFSPTYLFSVTGDGSISGGLWGCYAKGTQITLADGSTKNVEDITYSDELLVWDFDKGDYATAKPLWIKKAETATYYYNIKFESGDDIKLIGSNGNCHRLFSIEDGEFVYANKLVGKEVYTQFGADKVISCEVVNESVEFYNIITDYHINCFANEVLTSCRYNNIYPISNMKFVKDNRDIIPFESYDVPIEYYNGMRLGEQTIDIEKTNKYVSNLISLKDEK